MWEKSDKKKNVTIMSLSLFHVAVLRYLLGCGIESKLGEFICCSNQVLLHDPNLLWLLRISSFFFSSYFNLLAHFIPNLYPPPLPPTILWYKNRPSFLGASKFNALVMCLFHLQLEMKLKLRFPNAQGASRSLKWKKRRKKKELKLRELKRNEKQVAGNPSISAWVLFSFPSLLPSLFLFLFSIAGAGF